LRKNVIKSFRYISEGTSPVSETTSYSTEVYRKVQIQADDKIFIVEVSEDLSDSGAIENLIKHYKGGY
jgi:hypothetical protein